MSQDEIIGSSRPQICGKVKFFGNEWLCPSQIRDEVKRFTARESPTVGGPASRKASRPSSATDELIDLTVAFCGRALVRADASIIRSFRCFGTDLRTEVHRGSGELGEFHRRECRAADAFSRSVAEDACGAQFGLVLCGVGACRHRMRCFRRRRAGFFHGCCLLRGSRLTQRGSLRRSLRRRGRCTGFLNSTQRFSPG